MGAILAFPQTWRYDGGRFDLVDRSGTRVYMRQGPDIWWPEWHRGADRVKLSVWRSGPLPGGGSLSEQERIHWNKEIGPVCSVFPPPEWNVLLPVDLARDVAADMASALRHFTRTYVSIDDWPRRLRPVERVIFEGTLARLNAGRG
jgi:hypothetical protein